jgi:pimeloyl-ACP methyl ester carboxylesterase
VVLLHGAMESAQSHMQLAEALADTFTVYVPDRRGRGLSGPYGKDYSIQKDYDGQLVVEMSEKLENFRAIRAEVLLLGGSKSPTYLKVALDALEKVFPHAKRIEFPGLNHGASGNTERGGQPERVAQELRRFFAEP